MSEHHLSAEPTHSRWNRALPPRLRIAPGDTVSLECVDASGAQVRPGMTVAEYTGIDRERIHALTGPIHVEGAQAGDVLQVDVLQVAHKGWGWSSVVTGLGFLKQRFAEPYLFHWQLEDAMTRSLSPAIVPLRPLCGVMGVAPAEDGEFRTRPPGIFGGNMDVPVAVGSRACRRKSLSVAGRGSHDHYSGSRWRLNRQHCGWRGHRPDVRAVALGAPHAIPLHHPLADRPDRCHCAVDSHVGRRWNAGEIGRAHV